MGRMRKAGQFLGLIYPDDGTPRDPSMKRSRYAGGLGATSPRLDEDLDALRAELAALSRRVRELEARPDGRVP